MNDAIRRFEEHLKQEEKSPHTISQYLRDVGDFCDYLGDAALSKEAVIAYKAALQGRYDVPGTVNAKLCAVHSYLAFLGREECRVKAVRVQRRMFRDPARELSREEYLRLVDAAREKGDRRLFLLLQTLCATGIRISELRFVTVEGVRDNCASVTAKAKTRRIFLPLELRQALLEYARSCGVAQGPVFVSRNGNPLDRSNVFHDMKALCEHAGVERGKVFPHNLRHLFARSYYESKKDLAHLADILGHGSVETTRVYTISSGQEHEAVISALQLVV